MLPPETTTRLCLKFDWLWYWGSEILQMAFSTVHDNKQVPHLPRHQNTRWLTKMSATLPKTYHTVCTSTKDESPPVRALSIVILRSISIAPALRMTLSIRESSRLFLVCVSQVVCSLALSWEVLRSIVGGVEQQRISRAAELVSIASSVCLSVCVYLHCFALGIVHTDQKVGT